MPAKKTGNATPRADKDNGVRRRSSSATRHKLLEVAIEVFAERGYDGASTREITRRAGIALSLLPYYFESKEALWRAAVDIVFGRYRRRLRSKVSELKGLDEVTFARETLREYVRFSAEHPEVYRFIMQEGTNRTERMKWMVEKHVWPVFNYVVRTVSRAQELGAAPPGRPEHIFMMLMAASASIYALAPEFEILTGRTPNHPELIKQHADTVMDMFFKREQYSVSNGALESFSVNSPGVLNSIPAAMLEP